MSGLVVTREDGSSFEFDVTVSERYGLPVQVTDHAIEDGSSRADGAVALPPTVSTVAIVTGPAQGEEDRRAIARDFIDGARTQVCSLQLTDFVLDSMMLTSANWERTQRHALEALLTWRRVDLVTARDVFIAESVGEASGVQSDVRDRGRQGTTTEADDAQVADDEANISVLASILGLGG